MEEDVKLNYDDITVVPERITTISSRSQCNPYDEFGYLPIFASCMSSVVSIDNAEIFNEARIYAVIPRSYSIEERLNVVCGGINFVAFSLEEAKTVFFDEKIKSRIFVNQYKARVCIDLANGHMISLINLIKRLKKEYGAKMLIMTGNIANPNTYVDYEEAGVDYVRVGVGGGAVCSTSSNVAIHMPYFSLLREIFEIKTAINGKCKIIADGNIRGYRDIQKALIYADYVMIGGLFNKAMESAGKTTYGNSYFNIRGKKIFRPLKTLLTYGKEIPREKFDKVFKLVKQNKLTVWKQLYGQSTKLAQKQVADANGINAKLKTSEGLIKYQKVEYDIMGWAENERDYLRSAMSYTNSRTLKEYHHSKWCRITNIRYND